MKVREMTVSPHYCAIQQREVKKLQDWWFQIYFFLCLIQRSVIANHC